MKVTYDFINCKNKRFSDTEYNNLRNEQNKRVEMAFTHGFSVATITLVFFAAIFAFMGDFSEFVIKKDSIIGNGAFIDCLIIFAVVFFCSLPNAIVLPFSYKYHDNIRVITNIGAYCRVFYEFPSLIAITSGKPTKKGEDIFGWELLHRNNVIPHGNWLAKEYLFISIASTVLACILGAVLFGCIVYFHNEYFSSALDLLCISIFILLFITAVVLMVLSCKVTRKNTKIGKLFSVYTDAYLKDYVSTAVKLNIISQGQAQELVDFVEIEQRSDRYFEDKIKNLLK